MPRPPNPSTGFTTIAPPCAAWNARSRAGERVTIVGGVSEMLVELAQPARIVDQQRLAARVIEDPRRVQIGHVDRRVLAHHHDVEVREPQRRALAELERVVMRGRGGHRGRQRVDDRVIADEPEVLGLAREHLPTARARLDHQRVRRVTREREPIERVDDEQDAHIAKSTLHSAAWTSCRSPICAITAGDFIAS
jgi:hypothetical protein